MANEIYSAEKIRREMCSDAALRGNLEVLTWAKENGCLVDNYMCAYAALGGHLHILKWAKEVGVLADYNTYRSAIP